MREFGALAELQGSELLARLRGGTEMHKAWERGSGGSTRVMRCSVETGVVTLSYAHGLLRRPTANAVNRYVLRSSRDVCF